MNVQEGDTSSFTLTGLNPETSQTYQFKVMTKGETGYADSDYSDPVAIATIAQTKLATPVVTFGTVMDNGTPVSGAVLASWDAVDNAEGYTLRYYRAGQSSADATEVERTTNSYTFLDVVPGSTYHVEVRANGDDDLYATSDVAEKSFVKLATPTNVSYTTTGQWPQQQRMVSWDAVGNATQYAYWYKRTGQTDYTSGTTSNTYFNANNLAGGTYEFHIKATNTTTTGTDTIYFDSDDVTCTFSR